jgi:hypothetical protein
MEKVPYKAKMFFKEQMSTLKNFILRTFSRRIIMIHGWKLLTLQNRVKKFTIYNPTDTFVLVRGKTIFKITIQIIHIMSLVIGCCHICYILACGYEFGYKHACNMLVGRNVVMLELEMNHIHHEFI